MARFRRAFPASEGWCWNDRPKQGYGPGDNSSLYERFQFEGYGSSVYFPLEADHAHLVPKAVRRFGPAAESLQRCLDEHDVPLGCENQYVIGPQHVDAVIAALMGR